MAFSLSQLRTFFVLVILFFSAGANAALQSGTISGINDSTHEVASIAYTGSQFVAVTKGFYEGVYTSNDGITWTHKTPTTQDESGTANTVYIQGVLDVVWTGSQLVMLEANGTPFTSSDGINWTSHTKLSGVNISHMLQHPGVGLVTVAQSSSTSFRIYTSSDGATWSNTTLSVASGAQNYALASDGQTLLVRFDGTGETYSSSDATNWTLKGKYQEFSYDSFVMAGDNNGGTFVIAGPNLSMDKTTDDGASWSNIGYGDSAYSTADQTVLSYLNGYFVTGNNFGIIGISSDGSIWNDDTTYQNDGRTVTALAYGNGVLVAAGNEVSQTLSDGSTQGTPTYFVYDNTLTAPASNTAPTANAGADQTVTAGTTVSLTGSGSDSDGTISSYKWEQVGTTPTITLAAIDTTSTSFTAPSVTTTTAVTLRLTVTDDGGASDSDEVTVTVNPASGGGSTTTTDTTSDGGGDDGGAASLGLWWIVAVSLLGLLRLRHHGLKRSVAKA